MAYDGMYGDLSTRGTVNDILNQALVVQSTVVPLADQVQTQSDAVAASAAIIVPLVPTFQQAVTDSQNAASIATSAAATSTTNANNASASAVLSQKWAINPVDVEVTPGNYSSYHWAQKAMATVTGGLDAVYLRRDGNLNNLGNVATARTNLGLGTAATTDASAYQASSAKITNFNGTTNSADTLSYNTGATTFGVTSLTSFARTLIDDVDAATMRTTLGLGTAATTASTAYQPVATKLTNFNATTNTADSLVYNTAATTFAVTPLTPFMRTLLDDTDAATARATLGVTSTSVNQLVRAWCVFDGTSASPTQITGYNVASISKVSTGRYTIGFVTAVSSGTDSVNYSVIGMGNQATTGTPATVNIMKDNAFAGTNTPTSCRVLSVNGAAAFTDASQVFLMVIGNG